MKDKEKLIKYAQILPVIFLIIWIVMLFYIAYEAPTYADEVKGKIYPVTLKSKTVYLSLTEEILICGSTLGMVGTLLTLQIISAKKNKSDNAE